MCVAGMALLPFAHGALQAELAINNSAILADNNTVLVDNSAILVGNSVILADNKATLADIHEKVSAIRRDSHPQRRTVSGFFPTNDRILTIP
jgi:hypothetical protein